MFTQIPIPSSDFSAYYEDNSILIQFMIVEFVHIYQNLFQVHTLIQEQLDSNHLSVTLFPSLIQLLEQLVGSPSQQEKSSFSRWTKGSLTKFKDYCEQFSRNSSHQNKQYVSLHMAAHQTWLVAVHNLELLNSLYMHASLKPIQQQMKTISFKRIFNHLHMRFNQVIKRFPRVITDYSNNENIILCLLRRKSQFVEIYGTDFLANRFKWSTKLKELVQLATQRYQARGFEAILSMIQQLHPVEEVLYEVY